METSEQEPRKAVAWKTPDTLVILFVIALAAMAASYVIPAGYFVEPATDRDIELEDFRVDSDADGARAKNRVSLFVAEADGGDRMIKYVPGDAESDIGLMNFAFEGLVSGSKYGSAVGVVAFILIIGGAFGIVQATGAIELGIRRIIHLVKGREHLSIPVLFTLFSLGGAIFGMGVEAIAFAVIIVPTFIAMGYDSLTGVMTTYVASQIGFATSWMNPFSVAIAQGIAGVPVLSGSEFRMVMWAVFTVFGIIFTLRHALRVKANPEASPMFACDAYFRERSQDTSEEDRAFLTGHKVVLAVFFLGIIWVTYGVIRHEFYIPEIASQFFITGVACGLAAVAFRIPGFGLNDIAEAFRSGASTLLGAALIVGFAKGVVLLLGGSDPHHASLLNTILHGSGQVLGSLPGFIAAWCMFAFQSLFNFFITSGSGQAALTMPLMAPLADLIGLTRQLAVLAFQLGDGLTNLVVPTSAALMGTLAVARVDWVIWLKFQLKFQAFLFGLATVFLMVAYATGF